ncbi:MAG: F0F1 ATP synthase subunit B [Solirubrobacterales bacterium]|nr:F0F1 ATP synthase subunit B [Solirubrobacterales bacterium]
MISALPSVVPILAASEGGGEAEGGNFLVTPELGLMVWTLLAFGITLYVLNKFAFPRIGAALDKRQRAIEDSIDTAERTKTEAEELLAEYRERLKEARAQADEIVARARKAGETAEAEALTAGRAKREEMLAQTRRDIEAETRRAIQEIRNEVADLTIMATEKVTRKSLDEDDQRRLVEEALGELDFSQLSGDESARN